MLWVVKRFFFAKFALILVGFTPNNCAVFAGVLAALGLEANVGVDEATRAWLSTLPQTWRDQINKIVEDTLTSANVHLDEALTKIRKQLAAAEDEAACKWLGTNKQTVAVWKSELPFLKEPEPIRDLDDYIQAQRRNALDHRLDPHYMQLLYDDLDNKVAVVRCEPALSGGSRVNLESTSAYLSSRWIIWRRMDGIKCGMVDTCFANYRATVQKNIDDAQKLEALDDAQKAIIATARIDLASVQAPSNACKGIRRIFSNNCYDIDDYETELFAIGNIDDRVRLLVATYTLHQKLDGAVLTTQEVDPGVLKPGATLKSPNNTYFALMQGDCNFQIYKGAYTTSAERLAPKYVVANTATGSSSNSNCHLDLQRDRALALYADVTTMTNVFSNFKVPTVTHNARIWTSNTTDGGNADYWLVLLDSGKLETHAGTPLADGGALFRSKLLANKLLQLEKIK